MQKKLTEPGNSDNFCGEEWQSEAPFKLDPTIKKEEDFALSTITMVGLFSDSREIMSEMIKLSFFRFKNVYCFIYKKNQKCLWL